MAFDDPPQPALTGLFASRDLSAPHFGFLLRGRAVDAADGGRSPGDHRLLSESVPPWTLWRSKVAALWAVSRKSGGGPAAPAELRARMSALRDRLVGAGRLEEMSLALWEMENLVCRFFLEADGGLRLDVESLPLEVRPIAHSGLGLAAAMRAGFDEGAVARWIETRAAAEYASFAYEAAGALLAVYRRDVFGVLMDLLGRLGWTLELPRHRYRAAAFADVRDNRIRLLAHGYGRLLFLKSPTFAAAVRTAERTPYLPLDPLVRGITAAYVIVSIGFLPRALRLAETTARRPELSEPIRDGLINAMAFYEWMAPGCLRSLEATAEGSAALVRTAAREAAAARGAGLPPPFALGSSVAGR